MVYYILYIISYIISYIIYILYKRGQFANINAFNLYYLMDFKDIKGNRHYLYDNLEEFKALVPDTAVTHSWRDGIEGDWVLTDDDCVCQILKLSNIRNRDCIRTLCGTFDVNGSYKMIGENGIVDNIYSFSGKHSSISDNLSGKQQLFAQYIAKGANAIEAYKKSHPDAKSKPYIQHRTSSLLKTESIQKMIDKKIQEVLASEGATPEHIIGGIKTIADVAENDSNKLRAFDILARVSGLYDTQDKKSEQLTVWAGFTPEQLEALNNGDKKLVAHAEKETKELKG